MSSTTEIHDLSRLRTADEIRFALYEDGERILPTTLQQRAQGTDKTRTFRVDETTPTETRHQVRVNEDADRLQHRAWRRHTFTLDHETTDSDDVELVIETSADRADTLTFGETLTTTDNELGEFAAADDVRPVSADRVAGLDSQKRRLRRLLETDHGEWGLSDRAGILLEGPPGTGKTELVIETCEELFGGMPVTISGPEILSKWVGESERLLRKEFEKAQNSDSQVLYIDEIDAIARSRSDATHEHSAQLVAQLLVLLDGVDAKTDDAPTVVASTNLADVLDPALLRPGRLGNHPITFPRPDVLQRQAIFHHYLEQIRASENGALSSTLLEVVRNPGDSGTELLADLAAATDGYTGADIEDAVVAAVTQVRNQDRSELELQADDLRSIVGTREIQTEEPTVSEDVIQVDSDDGPTIEQKNRGQLVALDRQIEHDDVVTISKSWANAVNDSSDGLVVRTVRARELIGSDPTNTRDRVVSVFHHDPSAALCLYITNFDAIARAYDRTPLAATVVETMQEQLLRWERDNLLVYETTAQAKDRILAGEHLDSDVVHDLLK